VIGPSSNSYLWEGGAADRPHIIKATSQSFRQSFVAASHGRDFANTVAQLF